MNTRTAVQEIGGRTEAIAVGEPERSDAWYLDPLAAQQKRRTNLEVVRDAIQGLREPPRVVLKTDLFEEANGADHLLFDLDLGQRIAAGFDLSPETVARAGRRTAHSDRPFFVSDARKLALASNSVDLIISTSTLDHMSGAADLEQALRELYRALRPGGRMALTLDNPWNPVYPILRVICAMPGAPFELGYTTTRAGLDTLLRKVGFTPRSWRPILHNPRLASTAYFMALRKVFGDRADSLIEKSIRFFDRFEELPTRWMSCCFIAVCVEKAERRPSATERSATYRMIQAGCE